MHSEKFQLISDKYMLYLAKKENFCPYIVENVVQPIQPILDGAIPERMPSEEWQTGPEGDETEQPDDGGGQEGGRLGVLLALDGRGVADGPGYREQGDAEDDHDAVDVCHVLDEGCPEVAHGVGGSVVGESVTEPLDTVEEQLEGRGGGHEDGHAPVRRLLAELK